MGGAIQRGRQKPIMWRKLNRRCRILARDARAVFALGALIGATLALILTTLQNSNEDESAVPSTNRRAPQDRPGAYDDWLSGFNLQSVPVDPDIGRYGNQTSKDKDLTSLYPGSEADFLSDKVSVACLVFPEDDVGAFAVKETWGRHCNKLYFVSHKFENETIPVLRKRAGSDFALLCHTIKYIYTIVPCERIFNKSFLFYD